MAEYHQNVIHLYVMVTAKCYCSGSLNTNLNHTQMKTNKLLLSCALLMAGVVALITGCNKDDDDTPGDGNGSPVIVTGTLDATAAEVASVLAISTDNDYKQSEVANGAFSLQLDNGRPWGLVFLNSAAKPIGLLSLGNGIETLPLHYLAETADTLNLSSISRSGAVFTPSSNPIGNSIPLTPAQVTIVAGMDDYLSALLKNPDVNGNGTIDLLEGRLFSLSVIYFIKPGNFHVPQLTPSFDNTKLIEGYRLFLTVEDASFPEKVYFTGPSGSPLANTPSDGDLTYDDSRIYSTQYLSDPNSPISYSPAGGIYTVKYNNEILTFNLPDQSYVDGNIVYPFPTVALNGDGTMNKVTWTYRMPAGVVNFDVDALIDNIMVQIEGTGPKCEAIPNQSGTYGSDRLPASTTSHTLACQNIVWGNTPLEPNMEHVDRLMMTYEDHYGASYVVMYEKEY